MLFEFLCLRDMLLSPPTVLLMLCEFANSWGLYTLLTEGPAFFKEVLNFDIGEVNFIDTYRIRTHMGTKGPLQTSELQNNLEKCYNRSMKA